MTGLPTSRAGAPAVPEHSPACLLLTGTGGTAHAGAYTLCSFIFIFLILNFFWLFFKSSPEDMFHCFERERQREREGEREREKGKERNIDQLPLARALTGD